MGSAEVGGGECRDCNDVLGFVWLYLDHEAPPTTCEELEAHLLECEHCQRAVRFDRRFKQLVPAAPTRPSRCPPPWSSRCGSGSNGRSCGGTSPRRETVFISTGV